MPRFLFIDTSTERGVIAYREENKILFERELPFGPIQSKFLIPYLTESLSSIASPLLLDAIGVGVGPGSYTGIRLGVSVAQALAYCWKVPVVGVFSLEGFVPASLSEGKYAALLDARIGGVYFQIGEFNSKGEITKSPPQVCPIEEVGLALEGVVHLVTPSSKGLKVKLQENYPDTAWVWEERPPSISAALQSVENAYLQGEGKCPPEKLDLLYLRQTEAEREKALQRFSVDHK